MAVQLSDPGALHAYLWTYGNRGVKALQTSFPEAFKILPKRLKYWSSVVHANARALDIHSTKLTMAIGVCAMFTLLILVWIALAHLLPSEKRVGKLPVTGTPSNFLLGDLYGILWNGPGLLKTLASRSGWTQPFGVRLGHKMLYIFNDPEHVLTMFKSEQGLRTNALIIHLIKTIMSASKAMCALYERDRSGPLHNPQIGAPIPPPNERWRHLIFTVARKFLSRKHAQLGDVYYEKLQETLARDNSITEDWLVAEDFYAYIQDVAYASSISMLFGDQLLHMNPGFVEQVQRYHSSVPRLLKCYPRWLYPSAYRNRDAVLVSITRWLQWIDDQAQSGNEYKQEVHGSEFSKALDDMYQAMPGAALDTRAAAALGVIFATNSNTGASVFWTLYEVVRRPALLAQIREIARQHYDPTTSRFHPSIFGSPLLLSLFNETLRLRVHGFRVTPAEDDFELDSWHVPKGSWIAASSTVAHFNPQWWNTGENEERPLSEFWAERFIIDPADPWSGPVKPDVRIERPRQADQAAPTKPYFSTAGLEGRYFPFGVGVTKCPGRQIVEREVITTLVSLVEEYDIELLSYNDAAVPHDDEFFPLGVLPPREKVSYRIRRRQDKV